jgi:hypothetical protein
MWQTHLKVFARNYGLTVAAAKKLRCTAEHLVARRDGGLDAPQNVVAACLFCNQQRHYQKQPLEPNEYAAYVRREHVAGRWHGLGATA